MYSETPKQQTSPKAFASLQRSEVYQHYESQNLLVPFVEGLLYYGLSSKGPCSEVPQGRGEGRKGSKGRGEREGEGVTQSCEGVTQSWIEGEGRKGSRRREREGRGEGELHSHVREGWLHSHVDCLRTLRML
jgi:hypothetical protein